ncbi:MAG: CoA transferase [Nitrospinota bacterium]|mgnify:CR=1 FL=1|jgi:crotonobetainyl-CoA:carnitine CoA-transferase CaiB-like acyl-CoA transferase|nr:CoA transferase [Nitrospinota bacterium]MDP6367406.1 CoA transferase [Nitrospinota bacterium]MDP7169078.1 CoA transferase [Nitrospinota bacterium]MDP7371932.1 CoA transferase [Nitrospinota bacterium]MDP7503631.1 CoA transferase [Nitrospinota bacterium]|tara:strand:- start:134 stop:1363 length:1230 start_codon:yes stop_codon:yes gene_type:complete
MNASRPLEGLRVLAVEQFGAGPVGTMLLADMGAEIIKIENFKAGGDSSRPVPPYLLPNNDSYYFQGFNRNKKSVALDVRSSEGQAIFRSMVPKADIVFVNGKGTWPEKLGFTYKHLAPLNEKIVCCFLSGFGATGPRSPEPAYDFLMQAYTGIMSMAGEPDGPPTKAGVSFVDYSGGFLSVAGMLAALWGAERTGKGRDVDVALMDGATAQLAYQASWVMNCGFEPTKLAHSAHASIVPSQVFRTKNGWIYISCLKHKFYPILVEKMGRPDLADDPRFRTLQDRFDNRVELSEILSAEIEKKTTSEWAVLLQGHVPFAPVNTVAEALEDPQVLAREMIVEVEHPVAGTIREVGCPIKFPGAEVRAERAPYMGEHTAEVLAELAGIRETELLSLREKGVVDWTAPPEGGA